MALIGLALLTALVACARPDREPPAPAVLAVPVKDSPPADLLACPAAIQGFPLDETAMMPPAVRMAATRLATGYAGIRAQLVRLIEWHRPVACGAETRSIESMPDVQAR